MRSEQMTSGVDIPALYKNLLMSPGVATLSVLSRDGSIQSTLVWADYDGEFVKLNMLAGSPKEASIRHRQAATLLRANSANENQYISLRCELHSVESNGAIDHLNRITLRNLNKPTWYGEVEPADSPTKSRRVVVYLRPVRVYYT